MNITLPRMRTRLRVLMATAACIVCGAAWSQAYPSRPIRLIVPFESGGGVDVLARQVAEQLALRLGQGVVVENRGGAAGIIGSEAAARAAPDGYTLFFGQVGPLAINPALHAKLPYDPVRDFAPVMLLGSQPLVLVVNPQLPVQQVSDLVALAKSRPNQLNFASAGNGSMGHLAGELFKLYTGAPIVHVAYKSGGKAITDVMAGHVDMTFNIVPGVMAGVASGKLKALGSSSPAAALPGVPSMAQAGVPEYDPASWFGVLVPARTPAPIVERLHRELRAMLDTPDFRDRMKRQDVQVSGGTPAEFSAFLKKEIARWAQVVKASGAKAD